MKFREILTEKGLTSQEKQDKIAIIRAIDNDIFTIDNVEIKGKNIVGRIAYTRVVPAKIAKKITSKNDIVYREANGDISWYMYRHTAPAKNIMDIYKETFGLPFTPDWDMYSSRDYNKKDSRFKEIDVPNNKIYFNIKIPMDSIDSIDKAKSVIDMKIYKREVSKELVLPTKVKTVKEEITISSLISIGVSQSLAKFLMTQELTDIKKIDSTVLDNFDKEFKLTQVQTTSKVHGLAYMQILVNFKEKDHNPINISAVPKTHLNSFYIFDKQNFTAFQYDNGLTETGLFGVLQSGNNEYIRGYIYANNSKLGSEAKRFVDQTNLSNYLETEINFSIDLLNTLESYPEPRAKGEIHFGIGTTRRDQFDRLESKGFIKVIQDGAKKLVMGMKASTKDIDKKVLAKDAAKSIKKHISKYAPNEIGYSNGIGLEEDTVIIYYGFVMSSGRYKNEFGGPTTEYDENMIADEQYFFDYAKMASAKYGVKVTTKFSAGWDTPVNLIESKFRNYLKVVK